MSSIQQKLQGMLKIKTQCEKTEQVREHNSDVADMLEWSDQKCKATMSNVPSANGTSGQHGEQIGNVGRDENPKK